MKSTRDLGAALPDVSGMPVELPPDDLPPAGVAVGEPVARSQFQLVRRRFFRHRVAVGSLVILLILFLMALFAKQVARYPANPVPLPLLQAYHGPSLAHWFGTDELGRDQATRILYAARISLTIGLLVAICSTMVGVFVGAVAGYFGGWIDQFLMRITDLFLIVPALAVIAMAEQGFEGKNLPVVGTLSSSTLIIIILSFLFWMIIARVVRGLFLSIKEKEFVEAARASGASSWRVMFRHIIPNIVGPIAVNTTLVVGAAIVLESTLSFLGFGVKLPQVSLGSMLSNAETSVGTRTSYLIYYPGLFLLLVVLCVNFVGDGLRDAFDPQSRHN
jgi:peptide/nickel transport system permease protein